MRLPHVFSVSAALTIPCAEGFVSYVESHGGSVARPAAVERIASSCASRREERDENEKVFDLPSIARGAAAASLAASLMLSPQLAAPAHAYYDKTFPMELVDTDAVTMKEITLTNGGRTNSRQRGAVAAQIKEDRRRVQDAELTRDDVLPSVLWAISLWFLTGSRSNPLGTAVANLLYDPEREDWLKDRNAGLYSTLPPELLAAVVAIYVLLGGFVEKYAVLPALEGDRGLDAQLAGVALIGGASLELGRIAAGDKAPDREDSERWSQLTEEFREFSENRLRPGGNCHRTEIVAAFRRYFAKYRVESEEYPLTDLEIERLIKQWNREYGDEGDKARMTSSGFYYGVQINTDADVFAKR